MRELTIDEIDLVSAGPAAITPLALVDQRNASTTIPALVAPGIFPSAASAFMSSDPIAIAK